MSPITRNSRVVTTALVTLPTVIVVLVALMLMNLHIPTRFQLDVTASTVNLTVQGPEARQLLLPVRFGLLTLWGFERIVLRPRTIAIKTGYEHSGGERTIEPPLVITPGQPRLAPAVTLTGQDGKEGGIGILDQLWVETGAEVSVGVRSDVHTALSLVLANHTAPLVVSLTQPFDALVDYCQMTDATGWRHQADNDAVLIHLPKFDQQVIAYPGSSRISLTATIEDQHTHRLFPRGGIAVNHLAFVVQSKKAKPRTSLVAPGRLSYPDFPAVAAVSITPADFLRLDLVDMLIQQIDVVKAPEPDEIGIQLRVSGTANVARIGSSHFSKNYCLTVFDSIWHGSRLTILFSIACWVLPTTMGVYRWFSGTKSKP
jgi:hypothetical protein